MLVVVVVAASASTAAAAAVAHAFTPFASPPIPCACKKNTTKFSILTVACFKHFWVIFFSPILSRNMASLLVLFLPAHRHHLLLSFPFFHRRAGGVSINMRVHLCFSFASTSSSFDSAITLLFSPSLLLLFPLLPRAIYTSPDLLEKDSCGRRRRRWRWRQKEKKG